MRTFAFAVTLFALAAIAAAFPSAIWFGVLGCIVATAFWIYFSLRDVDLERRAAPPELEDGTLLKMDQDATVDDGTHG